MEDEEETRHRVTDSSLATESHASTPPHDLPRNSETLVIPSSFTHHHAITHMQGSSTARKRRKDESKEPAQPPDEETIVSDAVEAPQKLTEKSVCSSSFSELSPTSASQSLSSAPSPTLPEQRLSSPKTNSVQVLAVDKRTTSGGKTLPSVSVESGSASDGYNWRKYGQKQVKSPTGSRSYYRCTHSNCYAKKIKFCDHSGHVIEIVYRSQHSHDPPHKTDFTKESKFMPSNEPKVESTVPKQSIRVLNDSDQSSSPKEPLQKVPCSADKKLQNSSNGENGKVMLKEEHVDDPEPKRRMNKSDLTSLDSTVKPGKKPKLVVHAAGDVGISGDGYRWRKYGQKMVKGNPHFRNYYRCTSAGCPVRKHIETAVDNSKALIITYKGVHDHDMPVPKKRHGPPSAPLVAAAAPASMNNMQFKKTDLLQNRKTPTRWSVDTEGELTGEALDLGGEKAIESARTLLSIGFEIKPC
ncbi:probable WRKY transcription factor 32 isoform X2 [Abrus precatorius]|uniref:Probable WRKY transcription factor 32 isoform X2 n=1 Tax=Abrus precatorius TaxID=3816 RepID=A0A8B8M9U6_ABRPR|nr:probable WRKY transcription factor 32 isoform X2 [Abrus precatorius]